jgi:hypothetical protein
MPPHALGLIGEIADYLATGGFGVVGNGIWVSFLPVDPSANNNDFGLYESPGTPSLISSTIPDYKFQVVIRNNLMQGGYASVRDAARDIYDSLHNQAGFLSVSKVALCKADNFPPHIYRNPESNKFEASINFTMTVKEIFS